MNSEALIRSIEVPVSEETQLEAANQEARPLRESVEAALKSYFDKLDGQEAVDVYNMVLARLKSLCWKPSCVIPATIRPVPQPCSA